MRKKKRVFIPILITVFFILVVAGVIIVPRIQQTALAETFTPIYCNDYSFTCCVEKEDFTQTVTITKTEFIRCPATATKCEIVSYDSPNFIIGSDDCKERSILLFKYFACDDGRILNAKPIIMKAGEYGYSDRITTLTYRAFKEELIFTGRAGSSTGVPVTGADQCTFQTDKSVYDEDGSLLVEVKEGTKSYTVTRDKCVLGYVKGDRHICGNVEEQCDSDSDCALHTYGQYECSARTLQKYGCTELENFLPIGVDFIDNDYIFLTTPKDSPSFGTVTRSRCEIVQATTVQCCGDTDCGSNAFCDNNPNSNTAWTCVAQGEVQCKQDSDCGVSQQCDINTKEIKKPVCKNDRCEFDTIKSVDCCSNSDCATNWFCDVDKKCKESAVSRTACPFECCPAGNSQSDRDKYFDRACPKDYSCGEENKCIADEEIECEFWELRCQLKKIFTGFFTPAIIIGSIIFAVFMFAVALGIFSGLDVDSPTDKILALIVGIGLGFLFYFYIVVAVIIFVISLIIWMVIPKKAKELARKGLRKIRG